MMHWISPTNYTNVHLFWSPKYWNYDGEEWSYSLRLSIVSTHIAGEDASTNLYHVHTLHIHDEGIYHRTRYTRFLLMLLDWTRFKIRLPALHIRLRVWPWYLYPVLCSAFQFNWRIQIITGSADPETRF